MQRDRAAPAREQDGARVPRVLGRGTEIRLGVADEVLPKSRRILSERVGSVVARGDAELGLQQISELLPIQGIEMLGPLPQELQRVTVFSAGVAAGAREPDAARELIRFLASPTAAPAVTATGLDPMRR